MGSCITLNKGELKGKIENVKSKYILQKIFDNIIKDKTFKIVKYNKNIQNKININIDDYENYWIEKYKSIEIEIIPAKNKVVNLLIFMIKMNIDIIIYISIIIIINKLKEII